MSEQAIVWKTEYELGIPEIDTQHAQFLQMIRDFSESETTEQQKQILEQILLHLQNHMEFEEELMDLHVYPEKMRHYKQHIRGIVYIRDIIKKFLEGSQQQKKTAMDLFRWFLEHANCEDNVFCEYLSNPTHSNPETKPQNLAMNPD